MPCSLPPPPRTAGVNYLHINGVVHRDLKLENFVFSGPGTGEGTLKLIDFGFARASLDGDAMTENCGSLLFKAPEVMQCLPYSVSSDLWSLGVVCHMVLTGMSPWEGLRNAEVRLPSRLASPQWGSILCLPLICTYDAPPYGPSVRADELNEISKKNTHPKNTTAFCRDRDQVERSIMNHASNPAKFDEYLIWYYSTMKLGEATSDFLMKLLRVNPDQRMTAADGLRHPWLTGKASAGGMARRGSTCVSMARAPLGCRACRGVRCLAAAWWCTATRPPRCPAGPRGVCSFRAAEGVP